MKYDERFNGPFRPSSKQHTYIPGKPFCVCHPNKKPVKKK